SVDGAELVSSWGSGSSSAPAGVNFALTQSSASGSALVGKTVTFTIGVTESGSAKNAVTLTAKTPAGITASFNPASITPGTSAIVTLTAGSTAAVGAQTITVTGSDGSGTQAIVYSLTVIGVPTLALASASSAATVVQGGTEHLTLTASTGGPFTGNITWGVSGLPSGVTASWSANPMATSASPGSNTETLALAASTNAPLSSAVITVTVAGDGLVSSKQLTLLVTKPPGITLTISQATVSVQSLAAAQVAVTATPTGGLTIHGASGTGAPTINVASGLPAGFTATWSAPNVTPTGLVVWNLTLTGSATAIAGSSTLKLSALVASATTGTAYAATVTLPITVTLSPPALTLNVASTSKTAVQGKSGQQVLTLSANGTYAGAVTLSVSGLPAGVTAVWSSNPLTLSAENGTKTGTTTLTLTAAQSAKVGAATITLTAKGDGVTATRQLTMLVTLAPAR
ncbi:MAG: hypothetical protein ABSF53_07595, partial [Terracidiphilus sp.]